MQGTQEIYLQQPSETRREESLGRYGWIVDTANEKYEVCRIMSDTKKKGMVCAEFFRIVWLHEYC